MNQAAYKGSLYGNIADKARSASDDELIAEYSWVNPDHMRTILREVRYHLAPYTVTDTSSRRKRKNGASDDFSVVKGNTITTMSGSYGTRLATFKHRDQAQAYADSMNDAHGLS